MQWAMSCCAGRAVAAAAARVDCGDVEISIVDRKSIEHMHQRTVQWDERIFTSSSSQQKLYAIADCASGTTIYMVL